MMYRVIIVEDDPMVAEIDRRYVESNQSFQVLGVFKDGTEALEYLEKDQATVDLVILDYYTPAMTGQEFMDELHGRGMAPAVIAVTSANDTEIVRSMLTRGVMDYLVKPFEFARFQQALDRFLQLTRLPRENPSLNQESIDRLIHIENPAAASADEQLGKGLNSTTLDRVRDFWRQNPNICFTSEKIAEHMHLSRITIRRYVNYMLEHGELESRIDYQTGGRPSILYFSDGKKSHNKDI